MSNFCELCRTFSNKINTIDDALCRNPDLKVHILTDALRGTREAPGACSASLLSTLLEKHGCGRLQVRMYHTPNLTGIRKWFIPKRFNEGWGLQHMKLYGFDDEIMLSGANLSKDYFTNRQDRYIVFKSSKLSDYYFKVHQTVSSLSYDVVPHPGKPGGFKLEWKRPLDVPEPLEDPVNFKEAATRRLESILRPTSSPEHFPSDTQQPRAVVYPISQFAQLMDPDSSTEFNVLFRIFSMLGTNKFNWTFTAGYFNIHPLFKEKLISTKPQYAEIITAAPEANGFYKSPGISGLLPGAYSLLAQKFLKSVRAHGGSKIKMYEWKNGIVNTPQGWSYHAKGLWVALKDFAPCMTVIGSSNYTRRAYTHDLESNALVVTNDAKLQSQLKDEILNLKTHCLEMDVQDYDRQDRKPDWRQKLFVKYFGDKL